MRLRHLHLPSLHPHYVPYSLACRVQEHFRRAHLDAKDRPDTGIQPPLPTLVSFTPLPVYTLGRRQTAPLSPGESARLTRPLHVPGPPTGTAQRPPDAGGPGALLRPATAHAPRGGLVTYHGPGQVVFWPVLDLRSPLVRNSGHGGSSRPFTVRCWAHALEDVTIGLLGRVFGIRAGRTEDPGVWVSVPGRPGSLSSEQEKEGVEEEEEEEEEEEARQGGDNDSGSRLAKIAALGVHLRRHVTALGTAVNVDMPFSPARAGARAGGMPRTTDDEERVNPWARIVACGLEGKAVTSVARELERLQGTAATEGSGRAARQQMDRRLERAGYGRFLPSGSERMVAAAWADELAGRVGLEGVEVVSEAEAVRLMVRLVSEGHADVDDAKGDVEEERRYVARMAEVYGV